MFDSFAKFAISPVNQAFIIIVLGLISTWIAGVKWSFPRRQYAYPFVIAFAWVLLCSQTWFSYLIIEPLEKFSREQQSDYENVTSEHYVHVLACYYRDVDHYPFVSRWTDCSLKRLTQALILYNKTRAKIVVTGGTFMRNSEVAYAKRAHDFLVELGVKTEDIVVIPEGKNTHEEIVALKQKLTNQIELAVVSNTTHTKRLVQLLDIEGFEQLHYFSVGHMNGGLELSSAFEFSHGNLLRTQHAFYEYAALIKSGYFFN
ncbi:YdcF family protein [Agaribacter flavus]|uniref:YdcF family protein n=1 Tax=Agaribacter flavus TaxID=1902781 RepID=A0ABV7FQT9_9ALTE